MKTKILLKALRFSLLPTIVTILLILVGFFSFTETLNFVTSNSSGAILTRVALFIAEIVLVIVMYRYYEKEDVINNAEATFLYRDKTRCDSYISSLTPWSSSDYVRIHRTKKSNMFLFEKVN
jgi:hypothetical protein